MKKKRWTVNQKIVYKENKRSMLLENNGRLRNSQRTKHINVRYYFIKDCIERGELVIEHKCTNEMWSNYFTKSLQGKNFVESVSPLFHVKKTSPPTFIVHGNEDPIVPYSQSEELYKKLKDFNITTEFLTIPGGKHGKFSSEENALLSNRMWQFLKALDL